MPVYSGTTELETRLQRQPNLPVLPTQLAQVLGYLSALDRAIVDFHSRLAARVQQYIEIASTAAFGAATTSVAVSFGSSLADADYVVVATPGWNTKIWVTSLATSGFTITVSDAPGGGGGTVYWAVVR